MPPGKKLDDVTTNACLPAEVVSDEAGTESAYHAAGEEDGVGEGPEKSDEEVARLIVQPLAVGACVEIGD